MVNYTEKSKFRIVLKALEWFSIILHGNFYFLDRFKKATLGAIFHVLFKKA